MKKILILPMFFLLLSCEPTSFKQLAKETEQKIITSIHKTKEFNFKKFWYNIKTAFSISNHSKYFEKQLLNIETSRNTQIAAYQSIINECVFFGCNIIEAELNKNLMFPENITGNIKIDLPSSTAHEFITSISKYGNIVKNKYTKDEYIEKNINNFQNELITLQTALIKTNENLSKTEIYNFERLKDMQNYASSLNKKILFIEDDIRYLNSVKDKRYIEINIERGYNSTLNFVKFKIQNSLLFILKYIHIPIIILGLYLIKKIIILSKIKIIKLFSFIKQKKLERKKKQKIQFKIPPKF